MIDKIIVTVEGATEKAATIGLDTIVGVVGFIFASSQKTADNSTDTIAGVAKAKGNAPEPAAAAGGGFKRPRSGSGRERASDVPSWAQGQRPRVGENGKQFAQRLLDSKYGAGKYKTGPGTEFNKIQKWGDRGFE